MDCYQLFMCVDDSRLPFVRTNFSGYRDQVILGTVIGGVIGTKLTSTEPP